jgi:hypothetical protein
MIPVTPKPRPELAALCEELVRGGTPVSLARGAPVDAKPIDCFDTVERRTVADGGNACFGWALWEFPGIFLEAEFYSVWREPSGALRDVTPRIGVGDLLFLPDPQRVFDGRRMQSIRRPLSRDPAVTGFLRACDEEFALINRGARAFMRNVSLQGAELGELQLIWQRKVSFLQRLTLEDAPGV